MFIPIKIINMNTKTNTNSNSNSNDTNEDNILNDQKFWDIFCSLDLEEFKKKIEYTLKEFGTSEPCNRFDVGNTIEFMFADLIKETGMEISELPNARRYDLLIENYKQFSIKYSSSGDITLHNSNSSINKDLEMKDTILLTPEKIYLITKEQLLLNEISISDYVENAGDSLKLKRKILTQLNKNNYPFIKTININHNKKECKNRLCSKVFYEFILKEYKENSDE